MQISKRNLVAILILTILLVYAGYSTKKELAIEKKRKIITDEKQAPEFTLKNTRGRTVSLKQLRGKVVFLDFFTTWCPPCKREFPYLQKLYQEYNKKGLEIVGINIEKNPTNLKNFLKEHKITFTVLLGGNSEVPKLYKVRGIPASFIIDKKGIIRYEHVGFGPGLEKILEEEIANLLEEKEKIVVGGSIKDISLLMAFLAGMLTFFTPCILPLIPAYISFIAGSSLADIAREVKSPKRTRTIATNALFFILGFSLIFIILGATATSVGKFFHERQIIISKIAGIIVIIFGFHLIGLLRIKYLDFKKKPHLQNRSVGHISSFLVGIAFAGGWNPCMGPIIASILLYASTMGTLTKGIWLLISYSLGLGVPFFITAIAINSFIRHRYFIKMQRYFRTISVASGSILIVIGVLILTNNLQRLTGLFIK